MAIVQREAPDQSRHLRSRTPITALIQGNTYIVTNWSVSGFHLHEFAGKVAVGDCVLAQFDLKYHTFNISFATDIVIERLSTNTGILVGRFRNLSKRERELLRRVLHHT